MLGHDSYRSLTSLQDLNATPDQSPAAALILQRSLWLISCGCGELSGPVVSDLYHELAAAIHSHALPVRLAAVAALAAILTGWGFDLDAFAPHIEAVIAGVYASIQNVASDDTILKHVELLAQLADVVRRLSNLWSCAIVSHPLRSAAVCATCDGAR